MGEINQELKETTESWNKERREKEEGRDIWADFLVRPKSVIATMKNLENKSMENRFKEKR